MPRPPHRVEKASRQRIDRERYKQQVILRYKKIQRMEIEIQKYKDQAIGVKGADGKIK